MFILNNKFEIGEEVYSITMSPIEYKCPYCDGNGVVKVDVVKVSLADGNLSARTIEGVIKNTLANNEHKLPNILTTRCSHCCGNGTMKDPSRRIWTVMGPCRISSVRARFTESGVVDVRYSVYSSNGSNKRAEGRLFRSVEEAQMVCDELNADILSKISVSCLEE